MFGEHVRQVYRTIHYFLASYATTSFRVILVTSRFDYEYDFFCTRNVNYEIFSNFRSNSNCHDIWPDKDFANFFHKFDCAKRHGRAKKLYL